MEIGPETQGRVAILTAGAGGFGSATALMMAQEGARVVIADIDEASSEKVIAQVERQIIIAFGKQVMPHYK